MTRSPQRPDSKRRCRTTFPTSSASRSCSRSVFLLNGFYTRSRAYIGRYKMVVVMRGAGIGILTLLAVNYLFFRTNLVPRLACCSSRC